MQVAAVYCRLSKAKNGKVDNVEDQERRGCAYAAQHWPELAVRVYVDNNLPASGLDDHRPDFERLREDIARGEVAQLWAVEQTRLERTEIGWFRFAAALDAAGISEVHTRRDGIVRVTDDVAGIKAVLAAGEIRRLKARVRDGLERAAVQGTPGGGAKFGYESGLTADGVPTLVIVPAEAEAVRWAASAVMAGWSMANIAAELRDRGVATKRGGRWNESTVRQMLIKPSVAGFRAHHGEVIGRGNWEPILDEATWRMVCSTLATRTHVRGYDGGVHLVQRDRVKPRPRRRWLLTGGLTVCGRPECGAPMVALVKTQQKRPKVGYYMCRSPLRGGCNRVGVIAEKFEAEVERRFLDEIDTPEFRAAIEAADDSAARRDEIVQELQGLERDSAELGVLWRRKTIDAAGWEAAQADITAERARLGAELAGLAADAPVVDVDSIRADWPHATLDEKRALLTRFVERIVVAPAPVRGRRFDPSRITIEWRHRPA